MSFASGDFLAAYQQVQTIAKAMKQALDTTQEEKDSDLIHWLLKAQVYSARCLNKIKDTAKAEQVCEDVIMYIEEYKEKHGEDSVHRFMYQGVKAHYMRAKNMLNVMEYKEAKKILEEEAKPLLQALIKKFSPQQNKEDEEDVEQTKDLPDGRYSFTYRRKYVLYLKKFAFYQRAAEVLLIILAEEIDHYKVEENKVEEAGLMKHIKFDGLEDKAKEEQYVLKPSLLPEMQIRNTYYQLGKIYVYKLKVKEAVAALNIAKEITY